MRTTYRVHFSQIGKRKLQQASITTGNSWSESLTFEQAAQLIEYHNPEIIVTEVTMMQKTDQQLT